MCTVPVLSRVCLESYNDPRALYAQLKQRGMDLVTVTDHDSIDAVEELRRFPDFLLSEEVSCTMPSGTEMHAGVYGITEHDHIELQRRRRDIESLLAYAVENRLFVTVNHLYSSLTGARTEDDFAIFARDFHGIETRNGQMPGHSNRLAEEFARRFNKPVVGGSDSHTLAGLARTFTEVPGASNAREFLAGMRRGQSVAIGESGDYMKLTSAVFAIAGSLVRATPWMALCAGLLALAPAVTLGNYVREMAFACYWGRKNRLREPVGIAPEAAL
jgi:predicted metal-dependent phosphoesterase TrpH